MPTYEYVCKKCGRHTEAVQSFHDDPLTVCPHCKGALRKVFGSVGITFKGSGFYKTDSRPRSKESAGSSSGSSSSESSSGSSEKKSPDTGSGDKGSGDKGSGDKGSADKGSGDKTASSAPSSSGSTNGSKPSARSAKSSPSPGKR
ncbi:MAG TPA: FmdB family zinc ribbon protein [Acidimicrobiales bacterium]|nr:FmdB family zinc ribbon protein [Acidimicrobiales bacterium]